MTGLQAALRERAINALTDPAVLSDIAESDDLGYIIEWTERVYPYSPETTAMIENSAEMRDSHPDWNIPEEERRTLDLRETARARIAALKAL